MPIVVDPIDPAKLGLQKSYTPKMKAYAHATVNALPDEYNRCSLKLIVKKAGHNYESLFRDLCNTV